MLRARFVVTDWIPSPRVFSETDKQPLWPQESAGDPPLSLPRLLRERGYDGLWLSREMARRIILGAALFYSLRKVNIDQNAGDLLPPTETRPA